MAKVRVHELAKELGVESKTVLATLKDMGEFVKSASSTVEAPVERRLKEEYGDSIKIVAAEPLQGEPVQGLRSLDDGFIPPIIDISLLDRKIFVSNHDAIVWTRRLLDEEGIFAGVSSGAIASIAVRIANELDEGNVVFIVCDDGWKYLSSGIYTLPVDEVANLDSTVWW